MLPAVRAASPATTARFPDSPSAGFAYDSVKEIPRVSYILYMYSNIYIYIHRCVCVCACVWYYAHNIDSHNMS